MRARIIVSILFISLFIAMGIFSSHMYVLSPIEQKTLHDITLIDEPEGAHRFYGHLAGIPHTYEIRSTDPFHLFTEIRVPDTVESKNNVSVIVIKETGERGRVKEVTRILGIGAATELSTEPWTGYTYRSGGVYEADLDAGIYRIEVSTPDNLEPYILMLGRDPSLLTMGYFERIERIMHMKTFFGGSKVDVVESPLVYIPLVACILGYISWFIIRRTRRGSIS